MKQTKELKDLFSNYQLFKENNIEGRYLTYSHIESLLEKHSKKFEITEIGKSALGEPIKLLKIGNGKIKILAWSQMHGNESTTTKAIFDFLSACETFQENYIVSKILDNCSFHIIPILNPDGARAYTRVNANQIDLNRDAKNTNEIESKHLRKAFEDIKPDFCLNLHDQRSIFSAGDRPHTATVSFLSPAASADRRITPSRKAAMQLIVEMNLMLQEYIPNQVGRYDDAFNINCTGDFFQTEEVPTILFEAGHMEKDYNRENTRQFILFSIITCLYSIATKSYKEIDEIKYEDIPENQKLFFDLIIRNYNINGKRNDIAIQYKEELQKTSIKFIPVIEKIEPRLHFYGHQEIDTEENDVQIEVKSAISENVIVEEILLNGVKLKV